MNRRCSEGWRLRRAGGAALLAATSLVVTSCDGPRVTAPDQPYNEHEWIEVSRLVSGVRVVILAMPGHLRITQGPNEGITLRGEMALLPLVATQVRDGVLEISLEPGFVPHPGRSTEFVLSAPALESAELAAHGSIDCSEFGGEALALLASGTGELDFREVSAQRLQVTATQGAGSIRVAGQVASQDVELAGFTDYEARELPSSEARMTVSGSGSATVRVDDRLTVNITGSGSVFYIGDPEVESTITGTGQLVRIAG